MAWIFSQTHEHCKNKMLAIAGLLFPVVRLILDRVGNRVNSKHRKSLAEAMRYYRKRLKITQEKLGELADLNPKYIGEVERCEKTISVDSLARIAGALKVDLTVFSSRCLRRFEMVWRSGMEGRDGGAAPRARGRHVLTSDVRVRRGP